MKLVVIDGQGGRMGKSIIEQLKKNCPEPKPFEIYAIGTNSTATQAMMKAGADYGATGENPVIVNSRNADMIVGPIGIVIADSLLGEITPAIAAAIGSSPAYKILIPINRCNHMIVGCQDAPLSEYLQQVCSEVLKRVQKTTRK
ncbi:MAG: DUF3842 family protein [Lachnospiraceae bacterium]|nr:DUF3842 family protein [Lachnospiraceae bacterium]